MNKIVLTQYGSAEDAFKIEQAETPAPKEDEVLIKVDAFGLNFADVLARQGLYKDAPDLPAVLGYEVVGTIDKIGENVQGLQNGQRVVAFTRFGGYAEYAIASSMAVVLIPPEMSNGVAAALTTQYCTAYYCAHEMVSLFEEDHVLIHSAAGGVGTALIQMSKNKGCTVYAAVGSDEKFPYLKELGADHVINYRKTDFKKEVEKICKGRGLDVIFDPVGGKTYSKSKKLLAHGGRLISYGVAERTGGKDNLISNLQLAWNFGLFHPIMLLMKSQSMIGVNMLRIADDRPHVLKRCLENVVEMTKMGQLDPKIGGIFKSEDIAKAHALLENRNSKGKIIVEW